MYHSKTHVGVWWQLTIWLSKKMKECMVIVMQALVGKGDTDKDYYYERLNKEQPCSVKLLTKGGIHLPLGGVSQGPTFRKQTCTSSRRQ